MAPKKKNLRQQKQKQKQKQQQTVIVNVLTSKKRSSTKRRKPSSSSGSSIPLIQTLPIQYTPYTMYDVGSILTEANRRSLVPSEVPRPLTEPIRMQLADPTKATDTFTQGQLGAFLEDPNKQAPKVNDILDNVEGKPSMKGADATEENKTSSVSCPCGGKYKNSSTDYDRHINTDKHQKYNKRIQILLNQQNG